MCLVHISLSGLSGEEIMKPVISNQTPKILIVGAPHSGKRHYMASLLLSLFRFKQGEEDWRLENRIDEREIAYYHKKFFNFKQLLPDNYSFRAFSLIQRPVEQSWMLPEQLRSIQVQCICGRVFLDSSLEHEQIGHLMNTVGILFLVDPLSYLYPGVKLSEWFYQAHPAQAIVDDVMMLLIEYLRIVEGVSSSTPLTTPIVMLYTKYDMYKGRKFSEVHQETPEELQDLHRMLNYSFQTNRVEYCSAIGNMPQGGQIRSFQPNNVVTPFRWLINTIKQLSYSKRR